MMDDWMDVVFTFIMGFIIFFFVFNLTTVPKQAEETQILHERELLDADAILLQLLKSNKDLTTNAYTTQNYDSLDAHFTTFLQRHDYNCWQISISIDDATIHTAEDLCYSLSQVRRVVAETSLPVEDLPNKQMKIQLFKGI